MGRVIQQPKAIYSYRPRTSTATLQVACSQSRSLLKQCKLILLYLKIYYGTHTCILIPLCTCTCGKNSNTRQCRYHSYSMAVAIFGNQLIPRVLLGHYSTIAQCPMLIYQIQIISGVYMQGYKSIVIVMKTLYCLWLTRKSEIRQCCNAIMVYINFARIILIALKSCIAIKPLVSCSIIHIFYISYALSPTLALFMFCVCHIWV